MTANPAHPNRVDPQAPLNGFSQCHAGILAQLDALAGLPALMAAAAQARSVATKTVELFQHSVFEHHAEEESELFSAVLRSADSGSERDLVQGIVERLTREHRAIESLWKRVQPAVSATAKGKPAEVDAPAVAELVHAYGTHARFEETEFLPLAQTILGRNGNHMAALGLALHMRHAQQPVGYI